MAAKEKANGSLPRKIGNAFLRDYQLWIMVLPAVFIILIFNYIPMYGVQLAWRDFDFAKGLGGGNFAGFKYFNQYFTSPMFFSTLKNTFVIAFTSIIFGFPAPILMALLFNQIKNKRTKKSLQTLVYIPYFISIVVLVALMQILLAPNNGIISHALKNLGVVSEDFNLLGNQSAFIPVYVLSGIWQSCGWNSIIYFAALSSVDTQLYDAAKIDGASKGKIIWHIDFPALIPTIVILLVMNMGNILTVGFEKVFLMQNTLNMPVSEVISTYTFKIGIRSNQYSLGSAIGLFNNGINFVFLILANTISKKVTDVSLF